MPSADLCHAINIKSGQGHGPLFQKLGCRDGSRFLSPDPIALRSNSVKSKNGI